MLVKHGHKAFLCEGFGKDVIHAWKELVRYQVDIEEPYVPCWKYIEISSLRMLEVMAMIGVLSNCRMRCVAETPSRFGIMMSMRMRSYLVP